jgi:RsiW-degrading membrane proteinase PrsW (M82 family)
MVASFTFLSLFLFIFGTYIFIKYRASRNKRDFFKDGSYQVLFVNLALAIAGGIALYYFLPNYPLPASQFHLTNPFYLSPGNEEPAWWTFVIPFIFRLKDISLFGLMISVLITGIWLYYIVQVDLFQKEKIHFTLLCLFLGIASILFLSYPVHNFVQWAFQIKHSDTGLYQLVFQQILGVGLVEEFVKLVPVFILLHFTKQVDEPIDYIYYACVSALGFAFIENIVYFQNSNSFTFIIRGFVSTLGHMMFSSVAIYGWILYKHKYQKNQEGLYLPIATFLFAIQGNRF